MICAINIGNTNTLVAFGENHALSEYLIPTDNYNNDQSFHDHIHPYLDMHTITRVVIASVIPLKLDIVASYFKNTLGVTPQVLNHDRDYGFDFSIYPENTLGLDRILAMFAAIRTYGKNVAVVDLGTATTVNVVSNNVFLGGTISPGVRLGLRALHDYTGLLPHVSLRPIDGYLGKSTEEALIAGSINSTISYLNDLYLKLSDEFPQTTFVLTGGNSAFFAPLLPEWNHEPFLVLDGLIQWAYNQEL